jgi:hypothetical protein
MRMDEMQQVEVDVLRDAFKKLREATERVMKAQKEWDYEKNPYPRQCDCKNHKFDNEMDASMEDLARIIDPTWSV